MKTITIDDLARMCKQQQALGNGKKMVLMTSDDEGNWYHSAWFGLTDGKNCKDYIQMGQLHGTESRNLSDYVILS